MKQKSVLIPGQIKLEGESNIIGYQLNVMDIPESNFKFSKYGIKNKDLFCRLYAGFIKWCKSELPEGIFSTYMDGEPYCSCQGVEITYRDFRRS